MGIGDMSWKKKSWRGKSLKEGEKGLVLDVGRVVREKIMWQLSLDFSKIVILVEVLPLSARRIRMWGVDS